MENKLQLLPFQQEAIERMREMKHVFLFDDMGLGKTIQAIVHCQEMEYKRILVICPRTIKLNWKREIFKWANADAMVEWEYNYLDDFWARPFGWFILHHDTLSIMDRYNDLLLIPQITWDAVIVDECHRFRNWGTNRTESLMSFCKTKHWIFLSGTPIVNCATDLFPMLSLAKPEEYKVGESEIGYMNFARQHAYVNGANVTGVRNKDKLFEALKPFLIRRLKQEVLKQLPVKQVQAIPIEMEGDQKNQYERMSTLLSIGTEDGEVTVAWMLAQLIRLRQLALDPRILKAGHRSAKTEFILDKIEEVDSEPIVIFSTFRQYIDLLEQDIREMFPQKRIARITGTEINNRDEQIQKFQRGETDICLCTIGAGSEGITLTRASKVILADLWWTAVSNNQAIDRLHRIGQLESVQAVIPYNIESIDEYILEVTNQKAMVAATTLGDTQTGIIKSAQRDVIKRIVGEKLAAKIDAIFEKKQEKEESSEEETRISEE